MKLMNPRDVPPVLEGRPDAEPLSNWLPLNVPQVLPSGYPHNLPPRREQAKYNPFTGLDPAAPIPGPGLPPGMAEIGIFDPHHYASPIEGVVAVGVASILLISQPANRRNFLALRNSSSAAQVIFVSFSGPATANSWLRIEQDQIVLFDVVVPQTDVWVLSSAAAGQVSFSHSTIA